MLEKSSFIYFENFLPTNYFEELQQLMTSGDFEWFYRNQSTESDKESSFTLMKVDKSQQAIIAKNLKLCLMKC